MRTLLSLQGALYGLRDMDCNMKIKIKNVNLSALMFVMILGLIIFNSGSASAAVNATVCCEKTTSGLYCQNVPSQECSAGARQVPTAFGSTSFCKPGVCYNSGQGTCLDNTPEIVCNANNGVWSATSPAQCDLGCCILGDQAAFVTLTRCKYLSSNLGLQTNYNRGIKDELQCVLQVQNQDKGACVFDFEFQRTCKFTTREQCGFGLNGTKKGEFFKDKLCSAPELGTNCGKTKKTACLPGKDEIYFVDTCGNPANIYDAGKANDEEYWTNVKTKDESCNPTLGNANSKNCGNCNYLQGSICRAASDTNPTYGDYVCEDLNCKKTADGNSYKHGESLCIYNDAGESGVGNNAVGSRFYKHICINGEEVLEQCDDFRQQECIQDSIQTSVGKFSQAACRVNRWRDCTAQTEQLDCENTERRDCLWKPGVSIGNSSGGACVPKNTPGLKFWEGEETKAICAQGNAQCLVTFKKGLFGGETCKSGCDCLTPDWEKQRIDVCNSLGDCGPKINWVGDKG